MDWDKLKVFHAAAEAGSFTHAGEHLGLSQSAVSRQVSALETELGRFALPSPRARTDPDRARRSSVPHRARCVHEAGSGARQAHRQQGAAERRPEGDDHRRHRPELADAAARRIPRSLSRYPHYTDRHRRRARSLHARGRCGDPAAPAAAAGPDPAQALFGEISRVCLAGISQAQGNAALSRRHRQPSHHHAGRHGSAASAEPQLADPGRARRQAAARAVSHHQQRARRAARLPGRFRHRHAAGLPDRGQRPGAAVRRVPTPSSSTPSSSIRKN